MSDPIREAAQARSELGMTEKAFDTMREAAIEGWLSTKDSETAHREQLYRAVQVIDAVRSHLRQVMATGDIEQAAEAFRRGLNQPQ